MWTLRNNIGMQHPNHPFTPSGLSTKSLLVLNLGWHWRSQAAILPQIFWVEAPQLFPRTIPSELPVDFAVDRVSLILPSIHFTSKKNRVINPSVQTLSLKDAELTFRDV